MAQLKRESHSVLFPSCDSIVKELGDFFPTYSSQQNVHRNSLGNLAAIRAGSIICSVHFLFIPVLLIVFWKQEIPAQLLPAVMLLQPSKCTGHHIIHLGKIRQQGCQCWLIVGMVSSSAESEMTRQHGGICTSYWMFRVEHYMPSSVLCEASLAVWLIDNSYKSRTIAMKLIQRLCLMWKHFCCL